MTTERPPRKVITEDLGKIAEKAICNVYETPYVGKYKYGEEAAEELLKRSPSLSNLPSVFPGPLEHTAINGSPYDFENKITNEKMSLKTTKKDGKVCPQRIGQAARKKFCEFNGIDPNCNSDDEIKQYIERNVCPLLESYSKNTFDCPMVYYNQHKNISLFIQMKEPISWDKYEITFTHKMRNKKWNESTTIKIGETAIGEFQIHKKRDNIKFRWSFEKLIKRFQEHFEITEL
jgi:hypothetical protein